ncbi:MAG: hypothetical protein ACI9EF_001073 [Pseudohongiellaceae bacterium]|jgi:hypothetical protein
MLLCFRPLFRSMLCCTLIVAFTASSLLGQAPGEQLCGTCSTTGVVDLEIGAKWLNEYERGDGWEVEYCSEAIAEDDMALDWRPCPRCKTPSMQASAQARWDAIYEKKHAWLKERQRMDKLATTNEVIHLETTHFVLAWDVPRIKTTKKKNYKAHEAAHLYARRMETFYRHYQNLLGVVDADHMRTKHHIYIFEKLRDAMKVGPAYANMSSNTTARRSGGVDHESTLVMFFNKNVHPNDDDLYRHWLHSLTHQFTSVHYNPYWFETGQKGLSPPWLADKYGWMDAGLAHWFEIDFDGEASTHCSQEQDVTARWKGGSWTKNVWKAVMAEDVPSFPRVIATPTQALSPQEHQFVWSWVDYLMEKDSTGMGKAIKMAKMEAPAREILKECWGTSMLSFESAWAEWVRVEYNPSKKPPRY